MNALTTAPAVRGAAKPPAAREGQEGVALMLVLLVVVLLGVIVTEYAFETQVEAALAANVRADLDAYVAAKSAVASGLGLLYADLVEEEVQGAVADVTQSSGSKYYDSLLDAWAAERIVQPLNDGIFQCEVVDEYGKINLNALVSWEDEAAEPNPVLVDALRYLLEVLFEAEEGTVDALLEYIGTVDEDLSSGAEFYALGEESFGAKNGPLDSIEELLLVPGITPELYFDCNRPPEEEEFVDPELEYFRPPSLPDLLTVRGHPEGKINANTARPEVVEAVLAVTDWGKETTAERILEAQMTDPFESLSDLQQRAGLDKKDAALAKEILDVRSDLFRIRGDGRAENVMVRIEAYVARTPPEAAGAVGAGGQALELFRILDYRVIR